ncbi:hypothetical protein [Microbacterium sp.]|uniref:hypothetical protein n=1 Tax=Microbacterium sp. TaxID=51671 RepID=UPI0025EEE0C6|nr:hypothetical protein [Microbacterium sp.]
MVDDAPARERRISGLFFAGFVGFLAFGALNAVNFQAHGVPFSPLYTGLVATVGVVPGIMAGAATYLLNRALRVGAGGRSGNGWNWVGAIAGAAVLSVAMTAFLAFYVTSPDAALFVEISVAGFAMLAFLAYMAPGRLWDEAVATTREEQTADTEA